MHTESSDGYHRIGLAGNYLSLCFAETLFAENKRNKNRLKLAVLGQSLLDWREMNVLSIYECVTCSNNRSTYVGRSAGWCRSIGYWYNGTEIELVGERRLAAGLLAKGG